jgi:hypothetical protein
VELLAIVQAEAEADSLVAEAQARKDAAIKQALEERKIKLANIRPLAPSEPALRDLKPNLDTLKRTAQKNKAKAVKKILEAIYAA